MKWLYDEGCRVTGIEYCESAIRQFFKEQNLEFDVLTIDKIQVFQTPDHRLRLICCDIFSLNSEICGKVDAIWDRGGLVAIEKEFRKRYAALMQSLTATEFRCILCAFQYNDWYFSGEPRNVPDKVVHELYDNCCQIEVLDTLDQTGLFGDAFDIEPVFQKVYLLTSK